MNPFENLPEALRLLCARDGRDQKEIASESGISESMLSAYLAGRRAPSVSTLGKIVGALGVGLEGLSRALRETRGEPPREVLGRPAEEVYSAFLETLERLGLDTPVKRRP